ncbi:NAD(+) diphosphatase [Phaeospirillum tilakii]|uniref:NAD(+) diphosphatase n=1 Tax=Phaeospirillum tilakii TaxID=741673 RepID=A0ABW5CED2_9PROT
MNDSLCYHGGGFDRAAELRRGIDPAHLLTADDSLVLPFWRGLQAIDPASARAVRFAPATLAPLLDRLDPPLLLLGREAGRPVLALDLSALDGPGEDGPVLDGPEGWAWRGLRAMAPVLPAAESALLAYARAMLLWRARTRFCPVCGTPLRFEEAGHVGRCRDTACAAAQFPRTDPAVIALVTDPAGRALLGRQPHWTPGQVSCLAGFVEPGETLEEAVAREVWEEAGVRAGAARYVASQPWPFPASLMVGFTATAPADEPRPDHDELEAVHWFSREEVGRRLAAGTLRLPAPDSIAHRLIGTWLGGGEP